MFTTQSLKDTTLVYMSQKHIYPHHFGDTRCGSRILSRGPQLLRLKVADVVKQTHASKVSAIYGPGPGPA